MREGILSILPALGCHIGSLFTSSNGCRNGCGTYLEADLAVVRGMNVFFHFDYCSLFLFILISAGRDPTELACKITKFLAYEQIIARRHTNFL